MIKFLKNAFFTLTSAVLFAPMLVSAQFNNPLKDGLGTISSFTAAFLKAVVFILFPIAVIFVVYSGFLFVAAQGNSEGLEKAKKNFFWTIVGVGLLLGASALALIVKGTIDQLQ